MKRASRLETAKAITTWAQQQENYADYDISPSDYAEGEELDQEIAEHRKKGCNYGMMVADGPEDNTYIDDCECGLVDE